MKKILAIGAIVFAAAVFGWWAKDGMRQANQFKIEVCKEVEDDFGEVEKECEWKEDFHLGLMDGALPVGGGAIGFAGLMFFLDLRERKKAA